MKQSLFIMLFVFCSVQLHAQRTISGQITDGDTGEGLPGVTIQVKGTSTGTTTNIDGSYFLTVSESDVLIISYIGFITQEIQVDNRTTIDVTLQTDTELLSEIVVIGYGTAPEKVLTGSVASINKKEIQNLATGQIQQAIQGRLAGVQIQPQSGAPGSGFIVRVRGTGSNGNSEPLYIVDGMRTDDINFLSINDIESFDVLKDGASAAIYGAEGGNGVVIITTKMGNNKKPVITYNFQRGWQEVDDELDLMNATEHAIYMEEAGISGRTLSEVDGQPGTDWLDEIFGTAPFDQHTLSVSGGTGKGSYFVNLGYLNQDGIVGADRSNFTRYLLRANVKNDVNEWFTTKLQLGFTHTEKTGIAEDTEFGGIITNAILMDPLTRPYTNTIPDFVQSRINDGSVSEDQLLVAPNGLFYDWSNLVGGEIYNPLGGIDLRRGDGNIENRIFGSLALDFTPVQNLTVTTRFGLDALFGEFHSWSPSYWFTEIRQAGAASITQTRYEVMNYQWENFAIWENTYGKSKVNVLGGTSIFRDYTSYIEGVGSGLNNESENFAFLNSVPDRTNNTSANAEEFEETLASFYGRVSYTYDDKYVVMASLRSDGSSMLADGNKWGTFSAVSAGWILSEEDFFNVSVINFMKLRASWGQNGSLGNLTPGQWKGTISFDFRYPDGTGSLQTGAEPSVLTNEELTWETSEQIDIGTDIGLLDDRVLITLDVYNKKTKDLLLQGFVPNFTGNNAPFVNLGEIENKGIEIALNYKNSIGDLYFEVSGNVSFVDNEVTNLNGANEVIGPDLGTNEWSPTGFTEGQPAWYFRGYQTTGIFQNQTQIDKYNRTLDTETPLDAVLGDPIPIDVNGDGQITDADHTYIGDPYADAIYGARIYLEYKNFDFTTFLQGTEGNEKLIGFMRGDRPTSNKPSFFFDNRWTESNPTNEWFRATDDPSVAYSSDYLVFDGSYMRIKQIQLGYSLPENVLVSTPITSARFYLSLENYFTFTDYPGLDPEATSFDDTLQGVDRGFYPTSKTFTVGATIEF